MFVDRPFMANSVLVYNIFSDYTLSLTFLCHVVNSAVDISAIISAAALSEGSQNKIRFTLIHRYSRSNNRQAKSRK